MSVGRVRAGKPLPCGPGSVTLPAKLPSRDRKGAVSQSLRRQRESGFALLFVFAMAAIVSVMLYIELPRVAFEAQRAREQTLIDRGQQYVRAIQLYMRKFPGKYPASIDQLENTNNIRFLRRRFKDPMTGSDEWRIIHAGPGGVLTDSVVQKPPQQQQANQGGSLFGSSTGSNTGSGTGGSLFGSNMGSSMGYSIGTPIGSSGGATSSDNSIPVPSAVPRVRPSQMNGPVSMPGMPGAMMPGGMQSGQFNPVDPNQMPTDQPTAQYPGVVQPGQPVQFQPGQPYPFAGQQGQPGQPGQPVQPGQTVPFGQVGQPGQPNAQPGAQPGQPSYGQAPGQPGYGPGIPGLPTAPGTNPSTIVQNPYNQNQYNQNQYGQNQYNQQPPVPVINPNDQQPPASSGPGTSTVPGMIGNFLRNPGQTGFSFGNQTIGGGIAGVATKLEATGIKVYNDRTKYNEWEFVYDPRKDMANPLSGGMQGPVPQGPQSGFLGGTNTGSNGPK